MNKEEWLINEVDKWQDDAIIDNETGTKIKKQYELYRSFNFNIFTILFAILGATLIVSGIGIISFNNWRTLPSIAKVIIATAPLIISYVMSIFTIIAKIDNKIWKESSAFLNVASMFFAFAIIVTEFHFRVTLSQYLIISSLLTIPVIYIMQAVSPLIIYYTAILIWGSINMSFGTAPILLGLFLLGVGLMVFNIKKLNKTFKYNAIVCALAGIPFMILFVKMLNGDGVLAAFLYSTILFAIRDVKRSYLPFKLISLIVSVLTIIYITTSQAWVSVDGKFGGIILGILTSLILLASLAIEVFNTKDNTYEFSYLLMLMGLSIIRYVWGCIHSNEIIFQMVFMALGIVMALLVALGFVSLGKSQKRLSTSLIGFLIVGIVVLIKIFEPNLFFVWKSVAFLVLGSIFLILVIVLSIIMKKPAEENTNSENNNPEDNNAENNDEEISDGGQDNEEDNTNN